MAEVESIKPNGFKVVSTFSGAGGSCLGYRIAGYEVLWANEFIPAARDTYKANHPHSILDARDIRIVAPQDILKAIGLKIGDIDIFDGSPPCASFSTAGKREAGWGKVKAYSDTKQRTDDLFFEYARLLKGLQPKVFIAENVSGLVKGTAKGYFLEILAALKACGYSVGAKVLDAQWLGVPQMRQRLIFIGVRNDLGLSPAFPKPLSYRYSVREALPWVLEQGDNGGFGGGAMRDAARHASPTIGASPQTGNGNFAPSRIVALRGGNKAAYSGKGKAYDLRKPCPAVMGGDTFGLAPFQFEVEVESNMTGYAVGREWDTLALGEKSSKYQSLVKAHPDKPSPCVTQRGGDNTAASVAHPTERRKFSIAELKRIGGFPDDYVLTGTYAQRWERIGRAVPPVMMAHIAATVRDEILCKL